MTYPEFKARYALTPDPQQEAAILRAEGPTLLLAVPGSGKTTTLVTRLGYLIHCLGVEPGRILTVTYTVAAAGDMKRRFAALFGEEHAGALAFRTIRPVDERGGAERPGALADAVPRGRVAGGAGGEGGAHPHHLLQERDAAGRGGAGH